MIFGIGTDLIEVERVSRACEKEHFLQHIFTERERRLIAERPQRAAGNFAVKEAVVKAFGTGFGKISPIDIEVLREENGRPYVVLHNAAQTFCEENRIGKVHVSISNIKEYAIAYATAELE